MVDFWYFALFRAGLSKDLQTKLHGQHLAQSVVLKAIQGFINNPESNKPLTLSFHGWSGTGKNFVARMIADNLYRDGVKSECVRLFIAPFHFPHTRLVDAYKVRRAQASLLKGCGSVPASCWRHFQDPAHSVRCFVHVCVYLTDEWWQSLMEPVRQIKHSSADQLLWILALVQTGHRFSSLNIFLHNWCILFQNNVDTVLLPNRIQTLVVIVQYTTFKLSSN